MSCLICVNTIDDNVFDHFLAGCSDFLLYLSVCAKLIYML